MKNLFTSRKYAIHIFFLIVCVSFNFFGVSHVFALTVSPVKAELSGDPGQKIPGELVLLNEQNEKITFYSSFENFESQGESGTPNFVSRQEGLATWIKAPQSVILDPQEKKTIPFTIEIPSNADPGGHFAAIFWSTTPSLEVGDVGQVGVGAKIGTLVLLKVSGTIKEGGAIAGFTTENKQTMFAALPVTFDYRFYNSGGDRVKPLGAVTIKNIFGATSAVINANPTEGNILPSSVRKFTVTWTGKEKEGSEAITPPAIEDNKETGFFSMVKKEWGNFAFGLYTAELSLNYGGSNQAKAVYKFFIFPWQLMSILLVILLVILCTAVISIKKYNRWIISRAIKK